MHPGTDTSPILNTLRDIPMFRGVSENCRRQLARVARLRCHPRGAHLWDEGEPAEALIVILRGYVKVLRSRTASGVILRLLGPGDPAGAIAVHNRMPYPATAVCVEAVTVLAIPAGEYFELLAEHPDLTRAIITELTRLTLVLARRLEDQCAHKVDARIAGLLLTLARDAGRRVPDGIAIDLRLTRGDIAGLAGTTLETASRVMSRWARDHLVVTRRGGFVLRSPDRLRDLLMAGEGAHRAGD